MDEKNTWASKINPGLVWAIVAFFAGIIYAAGTGVGRSSTSIDSLTSSIASLTLKVDLLSTNLSSTNSDTRERLKGVEGAVSNLQDQVRDIRTTQQEEAGRRVR